MSAVSGDVRVSPLPSTSIVRTAKLFASVCADAADANSATASARPAAAVRTVSFISFTSGALQTKLIPADFIRRLYQLTIIAIVAQHEWLKNKNRTTRR